jgi:phosphodiesterase/alkaline phosphatase D-like protein
MEETSVGLTTATLNGLVETQGLETFAWFEWGKSPTLSTYDNTAEQRIDAAIDNQTIQSNLTNLEVGITHYYRVAARNGKGVSRGEIKNFVPSAVATVTTLPAASVGLTGATLRGTVSPNGKATTVWFEWGTNPSLPTWDNTTAVEIEAGADNQAITRELTGRTTGTAIYYRIAASNPNGTSRGEIVSFVPSAAATASTLAVTTVGASTATVRGAVNPNGSPTTVWFEYGTSPTLSPCDSSSSQIAGAGTSEMEVTAGLSGLSGGTTYYYRVVAQNGCGTTRGSILSFSSLTPPTVSTLSAASVGVSTATLRGTVNPNGLAATAWFEYGTSSTLSSYSSTSSQSVGSDTSSQTITAALSGLSSGTRYYFRIAASNSAGTQKGSIYSLTTSSSASAPAPTTLEPERIATGAICNGKVNPNGIASTAWIEWGTAPDLSSYTASSVQSIGSGTSNRYLSEPLTFLATGATYYCRVAGRNSYGTTRGDIASFTVIDGTWTVNDDFTSNDVTEYSVSGTGTITHNPGTGKAVVDCDPGEYLAISKPMSDGGIGTGTFSMEFRPTAENGSDANLTIRLADTSLTYFEFSANDGWFRKYRKGELVDSVQLPATYSVGTAYTIKITVGQMVATIEAFGARASMDENDMLNPWNSIIITATGLDATYDDIRVAKEQ